MNDLLLLIVGVSGAAATLCLSIQRSKCKKLKLCWGFVDCDRDTELILEEEKLKLGKMPTPRKKSLSELNKEVKEEEKKVNFNLELKEPPQSAEVEDVPNQS